jgi:hypothetical protein
MAAAVTQNTNDTRLAREEKAAHRNEPKLPSDRFTVTLNILQEYGAAAECIRDVCGVLSLVWSHSPFVTWFFKKEKVSEIRKR